MSDTGLLQWSFRFLVVALDARKVQRRILGSGQLELGSFFLIVSLLHHRVLLPVELAERALGGADDLQLHVERLLAVFGFDFTHLTPRTLQWRGTVALDGHDYEIVYLTLRRAALLQLHDALLRFVGRCQHQNLTVGKKAKVSIVLHQLHRPVELILEAVLTRAQIAGPADVAPVEEYARPIDKPRQTEAKRSSDFMSKSFETTHRRMYRISSIGRSEKWAAVTISIRSPLARSNSLPDRAISVWKRSPKSTFSRFSSSSSMFASIMRSTSPSTSRASVVSSAGLACFFSYARNSMSGTS
uniref:Uncharacterized protein n=1 Tax=Anopheles dirus TaxID=7168 RepID=A0A182N7H9_9DIPT